MTNKQLAAKEAHDEELAKLEEEVSKQLEAEAEAGEGDDTASTTEEQTSDTESADSGNNPSEEGTEVTEDGAAPDGDQTQDTDTEELSDDDVKKLSAKAQKRFKALSDKANRAEALEREIAFLKTHTPPKTEETAPTRLPWETSTDEPKLSEMTPEQYAAAVEARAVKAVQAERQREEILGNLRSDTKEVETAYPELNPEHESYDRELVTKISTWYKAQFKENNTLRLKDFVTELMSLRTQGIERGKSEVTAKLVKQAAEQALTPGGPKGGTTSIEDQVRGAKTMEELEALEKSLA